MLASAQDTEQRGRIYHGLERRNRVVSLLRIGMPVLGVIVLAGLLLQIVIASLLNEFGISNISIDRDNLVVETPAYSSMTPDGTMYAVESDDARASLGDTDLLHLTGSRLTVTKPNGSWMEARAQQSQMRLSAQSIYVPGEMSIADSRGTSGTITGVRANILGEDMVSDGPAKIRYHNGTTLDAESMAYSGKQQVWQFNRVTLVVPSTPRPTPSQTPAPASIE